MPPLPHIQPVNGFIKYTEFKTLEVLLVCPDQLKLPAACLIVPFAPVTQPVPNEVIHIDERFSVVPLVLFIQEVPPSVVSLITPFEAVYHPVPLFIKLIED